MEGSKWLGTIGIELEFKDLELEETRTRCRQELALLLARHEIPSYTISSMKLAATRLMLVASEFTRFEFFNYFYLILNSDLELVNIRIYS